MQTTDAPHLGVTTTGTRLLTDRIPKVTDRADFYSSAGDSGEHFSNENFSPSDIGF